MAFPFHDTAAGFLIRLISGKRLLRYPEEIPGFKFPYPVDESNASTIEKSQLPAPSLQGDEKSSIDDAEATPAVPAPHADAGDVENGIGDEALKATTSRVIHPVKTKDGVILVDWYSTGTSWVSCSCNIIYTNNLNR